MQTFGANAEPRRSSKPLVPTISVSSLTNSFASHAAPLSQKFTGKTPEEWKAKAKDVTAKVKDFRTDFKGAMSQQMGIALASTDYVQLNKLLDSAAPSLLLGSNAAPDVMKRAANKVAERQLVDAIASGEPKQLKGALVAAERLQSTSLPEFAQAVELYKSKRNLPDGWDVTKMVLHREGKFAVAKLPVDDPLIMAKFQRLLDLTHRKVYTRDRMGQPVPERLEIVRVTAITNDDLWGEYMTRREEVRRELEADPSDYNACAVDTMAPSSDVESSAGETAESIARTLAADFGEGMMGQCNEVFLFHGTSEVAAGKITTENLRIDLAGSSAGTLYGRGVYLAENASKSDEYSRRSGPAGERHLILCRTVLGRILYSDEVTPDPRACEDACIKGRFHSVLGDRRKCRGTFREFVVFDKEQVYPNWIITYRRSDSAPADPSRMLEVECPKGAQGSVIQVQTPDGTVLHVLVPQGLTDGQMFKVQY